MMGPGEMPTGPPLTNEATEAPSCSETSWGHTAGGAGLGPSPASISSSVQSLQEHPWPLKDRTDTVPVLRGSEFELIMELLLGRKPTGEE